MKDIFSKLPKIHFITLGGGTKGVSFTLNEWNQLKSSILQKEQELLDKIKELKRQNENLKSLVERGN